MMSLRGSGQMGMSEVRENGTLWDTIIDSAIFAQY